MSEGKIGCGCGQIIGLQDRKTPLVAGGIEHRYGKECRPVPERAGREGDQALPTAGEGDVIRELIARLEARRALGKKRYGTPLQRFNGRNVFRDISDEMLDAAAYCEQAAGEVEAMAQALRALAAHVRGDKAAPATLDAALALAAKLEALRV